MSSLGEQSLALDGPRIPNPDPVRFALRIPLVPLEILLADLGAVDHAVRIHRDAFCRAGVRGVFDGVGNERCHLPRLRAADADASLPSRDRPEPTEPDSESPT